VTTSITDVATQLRLILDTLTEVDYSSLNDYTPATRTSKVALLIVPFEQSGMMQFGGVGNVSLIHAHRLACEFWIRADGGTVATAMEYGRDICLKAMRLIAANPTLNGTVAQVGSSLLGTMGLIGSYDILPRYEDKGSVKFVIARLFVPVEMREIAAL